MLTLSLANLYSLLSHYFWPMLRILSLFITAPFFNEKEITKKTKVGLSMVLSFLVGQNLPVNNMDFFSIDGLWIGGQQLVIGSMIGLTIQLIFVVVRTAGEIIGLQMGLSFATFYDPIGGQNTPIVARILNLLSMLLFLAFNGHLWMLQVISDSFIMLPVSNAPLHAMGMFSLVKLAGLIFKFGLMLGMPVITLLLSINLTLGLLNRLIPQLSIFVIGFPLTLTVGMGALSLMMYTLAPFFENLMLQMFDRLSGIMMQLN